MNFSIKLCKSENIDSVVKLNLEEYGEDFFTNSEYFEKAFLDDITDSFLLCAFDNDILIGITGMKVSEYYINDLCVKIALTVSSIVKEEYRLKLVRTSQGLTTIYSSLLVEAEKIAREKDLVAILGFPNKNSYGHFVEQMDYSYLGKLDFLFMPLDFKRLLIAKGFNISFLPTILNGIYHVVKLRSSFFKKYEVREFAELSTNTKYLDLPIQFTLNRSKKFFNMRFKKRYRKLGVFENGSLKGYIIWKTDLTKDRKSGENYLCSKIVDFWINDYKDLKNSIKCLAESAIKEMKREKGVFIYSSVKIDDSYKSAFKEAGFFFFKEGMMGKEIPVIFKKLKDVVMPDLAKWHFTMADNDIV